MAIIHDIEHVRFVVRMALREPWGKKAFTYQLC